MTSSAPMAALSLLAWTMCVPVYAPETCDAGALRVPLKAEVSPVGRDIDHYMPSNPKIGGAVVDEDGEPLSGVEVTCRKMGKPSSGPLLTSETDEQGRWQGTVSDGRLLLTFDHPRRVRMQHIVDFAGVELSQFFSVSNALASGEYKVTMRDHCGASIGGAVVDEAGCAAGGAHLEFYFYSGDRPQPEGVTVPPRVQIQTAGPIVTDQRGSWEWDGAPACIHRLAIVATFNDPIAKTAKVIVPSLVELRARDDAPTDRETLQRQRFLLAKTYRVGAYRPYQFQGVVVGHGGRPVVDAKVSVGVRYQVLERDTLTNRTHSYCYTIAGQAKRSDAKGQFYFDFDSDPLEADEYQVLIEAPGHPLCCWIAHPFPGPREQVVFSLPDAAPLRVEIVDAQTGKAISGANVKLSPVVVQAQRKISIGGRALPVDTSAFSTKTDANGEVLAYVPRDNEERERTITAAAEGYVTRSVDVQIGVNLPLTPITIALSPSR